MSVIGWQNLASERQRAATRADVLAQIQRVHSEAEIVETQIGEDFAYWIGPDERLVGMAWIKDGIWHYACMNEIAFSAGVQCTLVHKRDTGQNRIIPGRLPGVSGVVYQDVQPKNVQPKNEDRRSADITPLKTLAAALQAQRQPAAKRSRIPAGRVYREKDGWYKLVETKTHVREFGPFPSKELAQSA